MALSNLDLILLSFLDSIDRGAGLPDGCDVNRLLAANLIASMPSDGWRLTFPGRVRLRALRSRLATEPATWRQ